MHVKEITQIKETLCRVTSSVLKAQLTGTLLKIENSFQLQCLEEKPFNKNTDVPENNSMEPL